MMKFPASAIKSIISKFDREGALCITSIGKISSIISDGVSKYLANDPHIAHFILFETTDSNAEVSFVCNECEVYIEDIESNFGKVELHYNFRDNLSEFKVHIPSTTVTELYFIKDNRYEIISKNQFIETTPQGKSIHHSALRFNGFCLRIKSALTDLNDVGA